jgi:hypothetical protein
LKSSIASRVTPATATMEVLASSQRAKIRNAPSADATLAGARNVAAWRR